MLQYPKYAELICAKIAKHFENIPIDTVISPAIGGIIVGQEVARQINKRFIFAERQDKSMTLRRGFEIEMGENLLVCEDVVTTGGSVFEVIDLIKARSASVAGVGMIVDRSNGKVDFGVSQFSTLRMEAVSYTVEECPMCKNKIPAVKPGSRK